MRKWKELAVSLGIALLIGLIIAGILLLAFGMVMKGKEMPLALLQPMAFLPAALGSLASAFICAKKTGEKGLLFGALCGAVVFLVFLTPALILSSAPVGIGAAIKAAICLICGCIGGVMGVNTGGKKVRI